MTSEVPNKAFFEESLRAALLRNVCMKAIAASMGMLDSGGEDEIALDELMQANRTLMDLGIKPEMHTIADDDPNAYDKRCELISDPVAAAEWLAGQVRTLIIYTGALTFTAKSLPGVLREHDELHGAGGDVCLVGPASADKTTVIGMIGMLSIRLDYGAGPSELAELA
jgi:hypothetical protein